MPRSTRIRRQPCRTRGPNPHGYFLPKFVALVACVALWSSTTGGLLAEDPAVKFLERLKAEQLFDVALDYLTFLEGKQSLAPGLKANIALERGMLEYQSASLLPLSNPARARKLEQSEKSLRNFVDAKKGHPRRGEARIKIGELLLQRAEEAKAIARKSDPKADEKGIAEAARFYDEAHKLFEGTIKELAQILEKMKGARTDPNDKEAVAYRQKVQQDVRQAQLLSAKSVEERGRAKAPNSKERKKDLSQALKMFSDLYSKEQRMVGVRNYALFYRSNIQAELGMPSDAIDGFQRVADLEGVDILRPLQSMAIKELMGLLAAENKFNPAIQRAKKWLAALRPNERETIETVELKLELARLSIAKAKLLEKNDPDDRVASQLIRRTREDLRSLLRIKGPHLDATRELLADLGVEAQADETPTELPKVKSFEDAIAEAQKRIDQAESDSLGMAILRDQGEKEQVTELENSIAMRRRQALALLREGLRLHTTEDELSALQQARFSLAYLHLRLGNPWEALSVGELLSRENPKTNLGLNAAAVSLSALSDLLRTATPDIKSALTGHLEPFAKYLIETWPEASEASAAASALVQLALVNQQWDKVDAYLALAPTEGKNAAVLRRDAGIAFYNRYLDEKKKSGEGSSEAKKLKARAQDSLTVATRSLNVDALDDSNVNAINALSRLLMADGKYDEASKLLLNSSASPIKLLKSQPDKLSVKAAMNSYRSAIQLSINQLATGSLKTTQAIAETGNYIKSLQDLAKQDASGPKTLTGIFVALASDLKTQVTEAKDANQRKRLSGAMVLLAREAGKAEAFNTQYWAADTLVSIAEEMDQDASGQSVAEKAYENALPILNGILEKERNAPGFIADGAIIRVQLTLAKAYRGAGSFKGAIDTLADVLGKEQGYLPVQIEAARTYQAWADASNLGFYKAAFAGGRRDPKTRKYVIWGWGKIAQQVEGNKDLVDEFYTARFELGRSRYKFASGMKDPKKQTDEYKRAEKSIKATATLYPELGGPKLKKRYDLLLKSIEKALGKPTTGLAGLKRE
ncbi:MAG: hypothetical protein AB8B50_06815 [Pirellulaceae bacterium]